MKYFVKNKHWNIVEEYNLDKLLYLLIDRPNKITAFGSLIWKNNKIMGIEIMTCRIFLEMMGLFLGVKMAIGIEKITTP